LQRRWQDGCRIWPLLARGFGHTLDVVPVRGCTTACWTCQALIHVRVKLLRRTRNGPKEQALAAQETSTWPIRRWTCRPAGWHSADGPFAARTAAAGAPAARCQPGTAVPAPAAGSTWPAARGTAAAAGCRDPARAGSVFPFRPAQDPQYCGLDVPAPDRRCDRPARFAPGVTFFGEARKPIA
jgi:hypothetical protein